MAIRFLVKQTPTPPGPGGDQDSSDYDRIFTLVGTSDPTFNENSKFGTATLKFTGNDQKLTTPANANLNIGTTFTIDFWMRFDPFYADAAYLGANGGARIISNYEGGGEVQEQGYEIGLTSTGELTATYWADTGKGVSAVTTTSSGYADVVTNGGWHHVAWQRSTEGESNLIRLFIDGVSVASGAASTYLHNTVTDNPFTIGARATSTPAVTLPFLYGTLDELEIIDGIAKFSTGGFTPPTSASTSTANHLLLMHFDDDNPAATIWYDATYYAPAQYWFMGGGESWSGTQWTGYNTNWTAQNGWMDTFRPERMKITGVVGGGGTISLVTSEFHTPAYSVIGSGAAGTTLTINTLTFDTEDGSNNDDLKYLQGMVAYNGVNSVQFDAKPKTPVAA